MVQEEIFELLIKIGKPLSRKEISVQLKLGDTHISRGLRKLLDANEICCIELDRKKARKIYGVKRKMRLYYAPDTHD
jgi:predicted transcriptional regulator